MKKSYLCMVLIGAMLMSGCSAGKILYPSVPKAELYYNTVEFVTKSDVRGGMYDDLFLNANITTESSQRHILNTEERAVSGQVLNFVDFVPKAGDENALCTWLKNSICQYGFIGESDSENVFSYYLVQNTNECTYDDYLNVMRALTLKYGECTTEVYKKEGYSVNNTSVSEDVSNTKQLIDKYNEAYANGEIAVESRWVNNLYTITVAFTEDRTGRITYEFIKE